MEVGIYANGDPIQLSPTREALPNATYAIDQDPRFRATTHGRIVNGVLTTDPVDVRFHVITNSIHLERPLQDARLRMTFTPDGGLDGILAGYTPVEELYDFQYGFRNGKDAKGDPAPLQLRTVSSIGQAAVLGHTCQGAYYAMKQLADGHRDPKTGQCSSISTQYRIKAIPAFVVDRPRKASIRTWIVVAHQNRTTARSVVQRRSMYVSSAMRILSTSAVVGGIALFALSAASAADVQTNVFQNGEAGFIVSHIAYALSKDANETGACPDGMTQGNAEIFAQTPDGHRHDGESDQDYARRVNQASSGLEHGPQRPESVHEPGGRRVRILTFAS